MAIIFALFLALRTDSISSLRQDTACPVNPVPGPRAAVTPTEYGDVLMGDGDAQVKNVRTASSGVSST